jgi:hypothetical protein
MWKCYGNENLHPDRQFLDGLNIKGRGDLPRDRQVIT